MWILEWAVIILINAPAMIRTRDLLEWAVIILINAPARIRTRDLWLSSTILSCMHQPVQPKSLSWWGKVDNSLILQHAQVRNKYKFMI
jgi:hypothetical protein